MKKIIYFLTSLGLICGLNALLAPVARTDDPDTVELNILTASESGTYYAIAEDLEKLAIQSQIERNYL